MPPEVVGAVVGKLALHKCCLDVLLEGEVTKAIERSGVKAIGQPALVGDKDAHRLALLANGAPFAFALRSSSLGFVDAANGARAFVPCAMAMYARDGRTVR